MACKIWVVPEQNAKGPVGETTTLGEGLGKISITRVWVKVSVAVLAVRLTVYWPGAEKV